MAHPSRSKRVINCVHLPVQLRRICVKRHPVNWWMCNVADVLSDFTATYASLFIVAHLKCALQWQLVGVYVPLGIGHKLVWRRRCVHVEHVLVEQSRFHTLPHRVAQAQIALHFAKQIRFWFCPNDNTRIHAHIAQQEVFCGHAIGQSFDCDHLLALDQCILHSTVFYKLVSTGGYDFGHV